MEIEGREGGAFTKWMLKKNERFYILFLAATFIIFVALSTLNFTLITGAIIAGIWIIFYFTIIRKG